MVFELGMDYALRMDAEDPLASFNDRFYHLPGIIYMDGNSLGLLSRDAEASLLALLEEWKTLGIGGWAGAKIPWITYAERLGELQAGMVGAEPGEVVVCGGTTVNLHALVATFYEPEGARKNILADELNFPSDLYALASQIKLRGGDPDEDLVLVESRDGRTIEEDDVVEAMTDEIALILLPSVYYKSGQLLDMRRLTREARKRGIPIGFDCPTASTSGESISLSGVTINMLMAVRAQLEAYTLTSGISGRRRAWPAGSGTTGPPCSICPTSSTPQRTRAHGR